MAINMKVITVSVILATTGLSIFLINKKAEPDIEELSSGNNYSASAGADVKNSYAENAPRTNVYYHQSIAPDAKSSGVKIKKEMHRTPTAPQAKEGRVHLNDLGYITRENDHVYSQYDISTLEEMADQGDFIALNTLTKMYAELGETQKLRETWEKEAVFGSTSAAVGLAHFNLGFVEYFSDKPEFQQKALTEGVAWIKFAMMRGDPSAESVLQERVQAIKGMEELIDWTKVEKRAEEIYQQLESERSARGFPPFENKNLGYMKPLFGN